MKEYFFQIKVRANKEYDDGFMAMNWSFPPEFQGKVSANDKKEAKKKIEEEFDREFPLRVLKKDYPNVPYLLKITEITERKGSIKELFEYRKCDICGNEFRIIDSYNLGDGKLGRGKVCSNKCSEEFYIREQEKWESNIVNPKCPNVIYKITNKRNEKVYIGQTTRSFTLRWWEHFCIWIPNEEICDFKFEILETVENKDNLYDREQFYIDKFNSIENGYNSIKAKNDKGK